MIKRFDEQAHPDEAPGDDRPARQYRQGDVLLVEVPSLPSSWEPIPRAAGRIILARGEATGHAHAIDDDAVDLIRSTEDWTRYLLVRGPEPAALVHEEHDTIRVRPGLYVVRQQREFREAPGRGTWRWVRD